MKLLESQYQAIIKQIILMSYKKIILTIASVALMAVPVAAFADTVPATVGTDSSAGNSSAPATVGSDSSAGGPVPATTGADSSAGSNPSSGGSPVITGGSPGGSSSSSSSGGVPMAISISSSASTCPLISSYMRSGAANNSADVAKLQAFLKDSEKLDAAVTGTFDAQTEAAVVAFQNRYLSDIMGPWSATKASGNVYITTVKKVNQLACSQPLALSATDLAIIDAYKANAASADIQGPAATSTQDPGTNAPVVGSVPMVGPTPNTAAVGNASVMGKLWSFIKNLF